MEILPSVYLELPMPIFKSISSCFGAQHRWGTAKARFFSSGLSKMVFYNRRPSFALPVHLGCCHTDFILSFSVHLGCMWEVGSVRWVKG